MVFSETGVILVKSTKIADFNGFYQIPDFGPRKHLASLWKTYGLIAVSARGLQESRFH